MSTTAALPRAPGSALQVQTLSRRTCEPQPLAACVPAVRPQMQLPVSAPPSDITTTTVNMELLSTCLNALVAHVADGDPKLASAAQALQRELQAQVPCARPELLCAPHPSTY
jgi:hypothetical protein